jgi:lipopolysaccharide biosynthesis glycosyltransferase
MGDRSGFHVTFATTSGFLPYVSASVASLREHNSAAAVTVYVDEPNETLDNVADLLAFEVQPVSIDPRDLVDVPASDVELTKSRLVKIHSMATAAADRHLYLDSDTLLCGDIGGICDEIGVRLGKEADIYMLLRRPVALTLWTHRQYYFTDHDIDRAGAVDIMNDTFDMSLPESIIDDLVCWNSGVILGTAEALRRMATRWHELYRKMLHAAADGQLIPRDQLSMWLALWELRESVRVEELPVKWNYLAGHLLELPIGTEHVPAKSLEPAMVLHFAQNKADPWARRRVDAVLARSGAAEVLSVTSPAPNGR